MFQFKKILIPLDGSELAERALQPALSIAQATSATLVLLRVIPPLFLSVDPIVYDQISQQSEDEALAYLRDLQSRQIPPEIWPSTLSRSPALLPELSCNMRRNMPAT